MVTSRLVHTTKCVCETKHITSLQREWRARGGGGDWCFHAAKLYAQRGFLPAVPQSKSKLSHGCKEIKNGAGLQTPPTCMQ